MRAVILPLLGLSCALPAIAQHSLTNAPDKVSIPADGIRVPLLRRENMPAVHVQVNGEGPFLFAVDTCGMGLARADQSLVKKLSLPVVGSVLGGDGSGRNPIKLDVVRIDKLQLGRATFEGVRAGSRDYNRIQIVDHVDGMLGIDIFDDHLLVLDPIKNELRIENGELPMPDGKTIFTLESDSPVPAVRLALTDELDTVFHLDTGNMGGITLPQEFEDRLTFATQPVVAGRGKTVSNTYVTKHGQLQSDVRIGGHVLSRPDITILDGGLRPNIGIEVLKHFVLTFDQKNMRVRLERNEEGPISTKRKARIGIAIGAGPDGLSIAQAITGSPAEKAGLKAGDKIVTINGETPQALGRNGLKEALTGGKPVEFKIERNGENHEFTVVPE